MPGLGRLDQPVHKALIDRIQDNHPGTGGTLLALETKGGCQHLRHSLIQISIVINDDGIFATHLADNPLDHGLAGRNRGAPLDNPQAHLQRAGKGDQANSGMIDQPITDGASRTRKVVENPGRQPDLAENLHQLMTNNRGQVGGFVDDRVAGHQRG